MRSDVTIVGTVIEVQEERRVGKKQTPVRAVIVETGGQYSNPVPVEFWRADECAAAGKLSAGQEVRISAYVNGREWNGKYYVSLRAREILSAADVPPPPALPTDDENHPRERKSGEELPF